MATSQLCTGFLFQLTKIPTSYHNSQSLVHFSSCLQSTSTHVVSIPPECHWDFDGTVSEMVTMCTRWTGFFSWAQNCSEPVQIFNWFELLLLPAHSCVQNACVSNYKNILQNIKTIDDPIHVESLTYMSHKMKKSSRGCLIILNKDVSVLINQGPVSI